MPLWILAAHMSGWHGKLRGGALCRVTVVATGLEAWADKFRTKYQLRVSGTAWLQSARCLPDADAGNSPDVCVSHVTRIQRR